MNLICVIFIGISILATALANNFDDGGLKGNMTEPAQGPTTLRATSASECIFHENN